MIGSIYPAIAFFRTSQENAITESACAIRKSASINIVAEGRLKSTKFAGFT